MSNASSSYLVIARKYRPKRFSEVVGQDHVILTLRNAIQTGRIAHAYLLVGPRGIGKTTTARLLAAALNAPGQPSVDADPDDPLIREILEGRSLDVREIDGASNNGVEQVRELREDVRYAPQSGRFKIYIIDEVHMLSTAAFNALLKTLEEPPAYVKFIFATTEVHKVPATIMSRCQRFDLRRIPTELISRQLAMICEKEGVTVEPGALHAIARLADGGMRDAQSTLDQMISFCGGQVREADVLQILGLPARAAVVSLLARIVAGDTAGAWSELRTLDEQGKDLVRVLSDLLEAARELLIYQQAPELLASELAPEDLEPMERLKSSINPRRLLRLVEHLSQAENRIRFALHPKIWLEVCLASAAQISKEVDLDDVVAAMHKGGITPEEIRGEQPQKPQAVTNTTSQNVDDTATTHNNPSSTTCETTATTTSANSPKAAFAAVLKKVPSYLHHGIDLEKQDDKILIRIEKSVEPLLFQLIPQGTFESDLRAALGAAIPVEWQRYSAQPQPPDVTTRQVQNTEETNTPQTSAPRKKSTSSTAPQNSASQTKKTPARQDKQGPAQEDTSTTKIRMLTDDEMREFQNDPQILAALERFGARLVGLKNS